MDYIAFGSSGGFTGGKIMKYLYSNGKLIQNEKLTYNSPKHVTELGNLNIMQTQEVFNMFTKDILNRSYNTPSNMNQIIIYKYGNDIFKWMFSYGKPPDFLNIIHQKLTQIFDI